MISKLSKLTAEKFIKNETYFKDRETYEYAFFIIYSALYYFVFAIIIGLLFNTLLYSLIFYSVFMLLRIYAGGYHANTETKCCIITMLSIFGCTGIIKLSKMYNFNSILFCIALICAILIFIFSPLDTPEKPLSKKEFTYFRKITRIILFCILTAIVISYCTDINLLFAPCCMSLILEGILIIAGKIKSTQNEKRANS